MNDFASESPGQRLRPATRKRMKIINIHKVKCFKQHLKKISLGCLIKGHKQNAVRSTGDVTHCKEVPNYGANYLYLGPESPTTNRMPIFVIFLKAFCFIF